MCVGPASTSVPTSSPFVYLPNLESRKCCNKKQAAKPA
jgi:hypothetical protein